MNDSRTLRIEELKRLAEHAVKRVEELKMIRKHVYGLRDEQGTGDELVWILAVLDNRRALLMEKIIEYNKGIELARDNAFNDKIGVLFIDGKKINRDDFLGSTE